MTHVSFISIHALREEGDVPAGTIVATSSDFYPRPPRGGRRFTGTLIKQSSYFYPRPPRGGRPGPYRSRDNCCIFLSTPSARRATFDRLMISFCICISIHALREEGDIRFHGLCT